MVVICNPAACAKLIERASALAEKLDRGSTVSQTEASSCRLTSSTELSMYVQSARGCAANIATFLVAYQSRVDSLPTESRIPFSSILMLQQAKSLLLQSLGKATSALERSKRSSGVKLSLAKARDRTCKDEDDKMDSRGGGGDEELASLLRTRNMLAVENMKMTQVIASISEGSTALAALHEKLESVDTHLTKAQSLVRDLLRVKTIDDIILRVTWLIFFAVLAWVWIQRLFVVAVI